jgi:hypothetical protein
MSTVLAGCRTRNVPMHRCAVAHAALMLVLPIALFPSFVQPGQAVGAAQVDTTPVPTAAAHLDPMTAAAVSMIVTADAMADGAAVLDEEAQRRGDASLTELAAHWRTDAGELRDRGIWMLLSQSASSMTHDPNTAHQLDLRSLRANGEAMIVEGDAMTEHGKEMSAQVSGLRDSGVLTGQVADQLASTAEGMIASGEQIAKDGKEMRDYAKRMLESLGE